LGYRLARMAIGEPSGRKNTVRLRLQTQSVHQSKIEAIMMVAQKFLANLS
jgi:hypothetical protein